MQPSIETYGGRLLETGYAGQVSNQAPAAINGMINSAATAIEFGYAVARGTGTQQCKAWAADTDVIAGIAVRNPLRPADSSGNVAYAQGQTVDVMTDGYLFAVTDEAVRPGDQVLILTAKGGKLTGTTTGAAGTGRIAVPGASWETVTAAGGVGQIKLTGARTLRTTTS